MSMSIDAFDWRAVSDRLSGVRDDDLRSSALLIAHDVWQRRAARGKTCSVPTLCWRALQLARRQAKRDQRIDVCSAAVESAPAIVPEGRDVPRVRLDRLTDRQRAIARLLMDGLGQSAIADALGCSQPTVSRECERIAEQL